ncbi:MAG TPA: hypothetical protein VGM05_12015 [Planctomycetaceae bacterium]|jgi:hypothetical protein
MPGMALALSIFGVGFAAFCVWLAVRIVNRRERWAKWTAIALAILLVVYPLSMGVSFRLLKWSGGDPNKTSGWSIYRAVYAPIIWVYDYGPDSTHAGINLLCGVGLWDGR